MVVVRLASPTRSRMVFPQALPRENHRQVVSSILALPKIDGLSKWAKRNHQTTDMRIKNLRPAYLTFIQPFNRTALFPHDPMAPHERTQNPLSLCHHTGSAIKKALRFILTILRTNVLSQGWLYATAAPAFFTPELPPISYRNQCGDRIAPHRT